MEMFINCFVPTEVSKEDFGYLSGFEFSLNGGYLRCNSKPNSYLHVIVAERMNLILQPGEIVEHRDRHPLNNLRTNLRAATHSQNHANEGIRSNNKSKRRGVSYRKDRNKWRARIMVNYEETFLGYFNTKQEAYFAYCQAAIKYFGEFANLEYFEEEDDE